SAWPKPEPETTSTPGTPATTFLTSGLNPAAFGDGVSTYRSAFTELDSTSLKEDFSEEANTVTAATIVSPITRAIAVDAVRLGLRIAFCRASSPGTPAVLSGAPITEAIGSTIIGASVVTPKTTPTTPMG